MTPGRLLYLSWHQPREWLENLRDCVLYATRDQRMRAATKTLTPFTQPAATDLPSVRFLTGECFVHQTIFCAHSLVLATGLLPRFEFFDDGTITPDQTERLLHLFPSARVIPAAESRAALDRQLPADDFPALQAAREHSPLMRKLLDLHMTAPGPSLYLDSDVLFFSRPDALLDWLRDPRGELFMQELSAGAYVDTPEVLASLLGRELPHGVNTGILAMDDSDIDWPAMERAAAALGPRRRAHQWAEQTLFAFHLSRPSARPLNPHTYRVCASRADLRGPPPVLRHYVHKAKSPYLATEWRRNLSASA